MIFFIDAVTLTLIDLRGMDKNRFFPAFRLRMQV
jgi:hypothetical protein